MAAGVKGSQRQSVREQRDSTLRVRVSMSVSADVRVAV